MGDKTRQVVDDNNSMTTSPSVNTSIVPADGLRAKSCHCAFFQVTSYIFTKKVQRNKSTRLFGGRHYGLNRLIVLGCWVCGDKPLPGVPPTFCSQLFHYQPRCTLLLIRHSHSSFKTEFPLKKPGDVSFFTQIQLQSKIEYKIVVMLIMLILLFS